MNMKNYLKLVQDAQCFSSTQIECIEDLLKKIAFLFKKKDALLAKVKMLQMESFDEAITELHVLADIYSNNGDNESAKSLRLVNRDNLKLKYGKYSELRDELFLSASPSYFGHLISSNRTLVAALNEDLQRHRGTFETFIEKLKKESLFNEKNSDYHFSINIVYRYNQIDDTHSLLDADLEFHPLTLKDDLSVFGFLKPAFERNLKSKDPEEFINWLKTVYSDSKTRIENVKKEMKSWPVYVVKGGDVYGPAPIDGLFGKRTKIS